MQHPEDCSEYSIIYRLYTPYKEWQQLKTTGKNWQPKQ